MYTPCDVCNNPLIPIIWGYPAALTDSVWELISSGQLIIGGCIMFDDVRSYCNTCNEYSKKQAEIPDNLY
jgi:hypothetical protein